MASCEPPPRKRSKRDVIDLTHDDAFDGVYRRLLATQPMCKDALHHHDDILALARELVAAGCHACSSLWISMKFAGCASNTPNANLMAYGCNIPLASLVKHEAEDLARVHWDLAPYARRCNIL